MAFIVPVTASRVLISAIASHSEHTLAGARCHQLVELCVLREPVDKRNQCPAIADQTAAGIRVGNIAHLLVGDVQELSLIHI